MKLINYLKNMTINNSQWTSDQGSPKKPARMYDIDVFSNFAAQVSLLTKQL